jgi:hypothetical protein
MLAVDSAIATRQTSTPSRSDKPPFGSRTPSVRVARLARCYSAPFIVDKNSIQQGYLTSEPLEVKKQGGFQPNVFLLADYGYTTYPTLVETRHEIVEKHPDMVQRFVDASTIGWYHVSTATIPRPTRRSRKRIRKLRTNRSPFLSPK